MRSLSTCLGSECNRTVDQGNYMENVSVSMCMSAHKHTLNTLHMCECTHSHKQHRGIKTLINWFLLPGVYSNALELVMEDIWR